MTTPGPKPTPTALKVVRGDRPSRVNLAEPKPGENPYPEPPADLGPRAHDLWDRLAPDLHRAGVLTWWDADVFAVYCNAVEAHIEATIHIVEEGVLVPGERGLVKNPAFQIQSHASATILQYAARFGLTPSDRQRLNVGAEKDESRAAQLLS